MICPNCKQEIEDGSIYCEHCGQTIQIVPDYNALDDVLPSILEENPKPAPKVGNQKTKEHSAKKTAHPKTGQQRLVIGVCCGVLVVIIGIFAWQSYLHSYTYFMNRGEALEAEKEYADAKKYYDRAYKKNDTVEATLACGRIAYRMGITMGHKPTCCPLSKRIPPIQKPSSFYARFMRQSGILRHWKIWLLYLRMKRCWPLLMQP